MLKIKQTNNTLVFTNGGETIDTATAIKTIRAENKLSTSEFGERLGVSGRTVDGWEQGRKPSKTAMLLLRRILG